LGFCPLIGLFNLIYLKMLNGHWLSVAISVAHLFTQFRLGSTVITRNGSVIMFVTNGMLYPDPKVRLKGRPYKKVVFL
jgi:hypothetical protein